MTKLALSITAAALLFAAIPATAQSPETATQGVRDNFFKPKDVTIKKGGKVTWRWNGSNLHNVAIKKPGQSKVFKRSTNKVSGKYSSRFRIVGKWRIVCEVHPRSMRGRVIVKRS
jgi:plastocyanin